MKSSISTISVIGLGHVGLPTAVLLADSGFCVFGMDVNREYVRSLVDQKTKISEKDFLKKFKKVTNAQSLQFFNSVQKAQAYIIAVPTPIHKSSNGADLSMVENAIHNIALNMEAGSLIIIESTSPIGVTAHAIDMISVMRPDLVKDGKPLFKIAYCPERVLPGNLIKELTLNDRVIGGYDDKSTKLAQSIYASFCKGKLMATSSKVAEAVKLVENSFRDVNLAFANEIDLLLGEKSISSKEVYDLANHHPRVNILNSGVGVGGHCIPIDPYFLIESSKAHSSILSLSRIINDSIPSKRADQIYKILKQKQHKKICFLGLTYKPDVHDFRESPALELLSKFTKKRSLNISVYDPFLNSKNSSFLHSRFTLLEKAPSSKSFDCIIVLVDHSDFQVLYKNFKNSSTQLLKFF
jgi:UDP-N-acetyl-D-mannosaminuronic acid dehydrogenase